MSKDKPTIKRLSLPSGGWWEFETRPRWKHLRAWTALCADGSVQTGEGDLADRVVISLTTGWSFDEPISLASLGRRDPEDMIAAMELVKREAAPLLDTNDPRSLAEQLLHGLVEGRIPEEFAEVHIMALTGWSWAELQDTPADVVERMALYLAVKQTREVGGILELKEKRNG